MSANEQQPENNTIYFYKDISYKDLAVWSFEAIAGCVCGRLFGAAFPPFEAVVGAVAGGAVGFVSAIVRKKDFTEEVGNGLIIGFLGGGANAAWDYLPTLLPHAPTAATTPQASEIVACNSSHYCCGTTGLATSPDGNTLYSVSSNMTLPFNQASLPDGHIVSNILACHEKIGSIADFQIYEAFTNSGGPRAALQPMLHPIFAYHP